MTIDLVLCENVSTRSRCLRSGKTKNTLLARHKLDRARTGHNDEQEWS